jgi:hypothetical protein
MGIKPIFTQTLYGQHIRLFIIISLIFSIIFVNEVKAFSNKYVYYALSFIFLTMTLFFYEYIGIDIVILSAILYMSLWNLHNIDLHAVNTD